MKRIPLVFLTLPLLVSCSGQDRREFYYFLNEQYRMTECADMGIEMPNAHAYFSQFNPGKVFYTQYFDTINSILELRVKVDEMNKPHGYGFIRLYKKDGEEVLNITIESYIARQIDYQWGSFYYHGFSDEEKIYFLTKENVRFRYPVYIEEIDQEVLITFGYNLSKIYDYPSEFKDLSWLV